MKNLTRIFVAILTATTFIVNAQQATSASQIEKALQQKEALTKSSIVKNIEFTNIGPTVMSGRVVDIDVNPNNTNEFYVGYASGGLWYTNNNGTSFTPVMDNSPTQNVGDIAIDWKNGTIWVGTGESNSSRSSYSGIGILKSTDKGKTWKNVGLTDSHHIGRIIINKNNPNEVVVGVIGHLYSKNKQRGIYKTTDGGKTWKNTLFIDDMTGVIDIAVSPKNPNVLFAASWERIRKAWDFDGDGNGSAIYKSTDAGTTWKKLTTKGKGFPVGTGVGRIGLAAFNDDIVYAFHDNQFRRPAKPKKKGAGIQKDDFKTMSVENFLKLDDKQLNRYLRSNRFDRKITATSVKKSVKSDKKFKNKKTEISVLLTDTKKMEKLNLKFRNKKKDTDILSFPSENSVFYEKKIKCKNIYFGDLALSFSFIKKQKENFSDYYRNILVHGFLHLIGYDHDNQKNFIKMEKAQNKILKLL